MLNGEEGPYSTFFDLLLCTTSDSGEFSLYFDSVITVEMYTENQLYFLRWGNHVPYAVDFFTMLGSHRQDGCWMKDFYSNYFQHINMQFTEEGTFEFAFKVHQLLPDSYYITPRYRLKLWLDESDLMYAELTLID